MLFNGLAFDALFRRITVGCVRFYRRFALCGTSGHALGVIPPLGWTIERAHAFACAGCFPIGCLAAGASTVSGYAFDDRNGCSVFADCGDDGHGQQLSHFGF